VTEQPEANVVEAPGSSVVEQPGADVVAHPGAGQQSSVAARAHGVRARLAASGDAATRALHRLRRDGTSPAAGEAPDAEAVQHAATGHVPVADQVQRMRTQVADAGAATRRTLDRVGWARVIVIAVVQLVIGLVLWRMKVRRDRRHQRRVQLWVEDVLGSIPPRRRGLRRRLRV
jgi:hypothetical protein